MRSVQNSHRRVSMVVDGRRPALLPGRHLREAGYENSRAACRDASPDVAVARQSAAFSFHVRRQRQMSLQAAASELVMRAFHRIVMCAFRNRPTMLQRISSYSSNANQHSKFFLFFRCVSKLVMTGHSKEGAYRYIYPKNQSRKIILCTILQPMTSGASI